MDITFSLLAKFGMFLYKCPSEKVAYEFVLISPAVSSMSCLHGLPDER